MTILLSKPITVAVANQLGSIFQYLDDDPHNLALQASFAGTGGTSADAYVQTSFDAGATWRDIANFHFTAAGAGFFNLSSLTPQTTQITTMPSGSIAANTAQDGYLGSQLRVLYTTVGTWTSGLLIVRAASSRLRIVDTAAVGGD